MTSARGKATPTGWRDDSLDWKGISADEITKRVTSQVQPGSIILFHNAAEHTPEALPGILQFLIAQGYTIVPISQLIYQGQCGTDYTIDHTGRQSAVRKTADGSAQSQSGAASQSNAAAQSGAAQPRS